MGRVCAYAIGSRILTPVSHARLTLLRPWFYQLRKRLKGRTRQSAQNRALHSMLSPNGTRYTGNVLAVWIGAVRESCTAQSDAHFAMIRTTSRCRMARCWNTEVQKYIPRRA